MSNGPFFRTSLKSLGPGIDFLVPEGPFAEYWPHKHLTADAVLPDQGSGERRWEAAMYDVA